MDPNMAFDTAFKKTMEIEGRGQLSDNQLDPGGQTFSGISRVYWPSWEGWSFIDAWVRDKGQPFPSAELDPMVRTFYKVNFWDRIQGDKLADISVPVACEVFDSAVNVDVRLAVVWLQEGHNVASCGRYELEVDGELGPRTLETIRNYLATEPRRENLEILLNCMNGEQYLWYKKNPRRRIFRGWFRRV
jgi:lysozyme family protein